MEFITRARASIAFALTKKKPTLPDQTIAASGNVVKEIIA